MKIHFASGTHPFSDGWLNVDALRFDGVDEIVDLLSDFPPFLTDIDTSYVGHFLEHLTVAEGVEFLSRVKERTKPGGKLVVVGPDVDKARDWFNRGLIGADLLAAAGAHGSIPDDEPWNRVGIHVWNCTGAAVVEQCLAAGWTSVEEVPLGKLPLLMPDVPMIDSSEWQFCVVASA